ncbi:MAG TPA: hypothetical protein DDX54_06625 [Rhodospirillaceae bacterium]|jgi:hypothetical protein|nr:hypothetical protein [Alphaproteobacteria bacterium]HBH27057.1 hypothetical protein [Rhodospirillaceae bacterium]
MEISELTALGHENKGMLRAVRANCLECCCGSAPEVALCQLTACPLWPYRRGTNPFRKKPALTPEHKAALTARLAGRREA